MKRRDIVKKLLAAGYHKGRDRGDHTIYEKEGCRSIPVPRHREVNENLSKSILKQAGLK